MWRHDGAGLRALGMHVGSVQNANGVRIGAAYIPINTLLEQWGATMNVFPQTLTSRSAMMPADGKPQEGSGLGPNESISLSSSLPDVCLSDDCVLIVE